MKTSISKILSITRNGDEFSIVGMKGNVRYLYQNRRHEPTAIIPFHANKVPGIVVPLARCPHALVERAHLHLGLTKAKKVKEFYTSNEIAHIWANQAAPEGRSPGNMHFNGDAFYSYGTVIARWMQHDGKQAVVRDTATFSSSTNKHQGDVRSALSASVKQFTVHSGSRGQSLYYTPQNLRDEYLAEFKHKKNQDSKFDYVLAADVLRRASYLTKAIEVCEYFGLPKHRLVQKSKRLRPEVEDAAEIVAAREQALAERRKNRDAKRLHVSIATAVNYAHRYLGDPAMIRYYGAKSLLAEHAGDVWAQVEPVIKQRQAAGIQAWRDGTTNEHDYHWPVMLRCEDDEMVTSKGARVPIADAERAYRFACLKGKATKCPQCGRVSVNTTCPKCVVPATPIGWRANGEQCEVGHYKLDAVNSEGIVAGCHRISWQECHQFAIKMGWNK